jgi:hypothetical protein
MKYRARPLSPTPIRKFHEELKPANVARFEQKTGQAKPLSL